MKRVCVFKAIAEFKNKKGSRFRRLPNYPLINLPTGR
jgi:hypothetical protein